jgi:hypothetical protein
VQQERKLEPRRSRDDAELEPALWHGRYHAARALEADPTRASLCGGWCRCLTSKSALLALIPGYQYGV